MSRNALALVDCSSREKLFHYLINTFDRKTTKKEMISPYDDQLIGKMNFRYSGLEHAMFFTYARSSEYPGMKFRNHKIIYLSLDVNDISTAVFNQICTRFGGYIIYDDELKNEWEKIDRQQPDNDDDLTLSDDIVAERRFLFDIEGETQEQKEYQELKIEPDVEEEAEEREWAVPESKQESKAETGREKKDNNRGSRNGRGGNRQESGERKERQERQQPAERKEFGKDAVKDAHKENKKDSAKEKRKDGAKEQVKEVAREIKKDEIKAVPKESSKDGSKETAKENQKHHNNHRRGHRGGRKHASGKPQQKEGGNQQNAAAKDNNPSQQK